MLIRIVHLYFAPEHIAQFRALFDAAAPYIRAYKGCRHLELWQSLDAPHHFTTYSIWEDEQALNNYRESPLFRTTWNQTKILFAALPVAYSYSKADP